LSGPGPGGRLADSIAPGGITVAEATEATPEVVTALRGLLPQLSSSAPPLAEEHVRELVASPATVLLVARDGTDQIVGTLTLALFRIPTGLRAWIEDVITDEAARGQGVGQALTLAAIDRAREAGARTVDLTSAPKREAANALYRKLGFQTRDTNVYRLTL
jgi:ribosomal protein S18 acetylase RimI-like enzyme